MSENPSYRFDVMALAADKRSWVEVGALWSFTSNATGEEFLSGRIDDPSMDKPIEVQHFRQEDGSYNIAWRRPVAVPLCPVSLPATATISRRCPAATAVTTTRVALHRRAMASARARPRVRPPARAAASRRNSSTPDDRGLGRFSSALFCHIARENACF